MASFTFGSPLFIATTPFGRSSAASSPAPVDGTLSPAKTAFDSAPNFNTPMSLPIARGVFTHCRSISHPSSSDIGSEPFEYILNYDGLPARSPAHKAGPLNTPLPSSFLSTVGLKCQEAEPYEPVSPRGPSPFGAIGQGRPRSTSPRPLTTEAVDSYFPPYESYESRSTFRFNPFRDWDAVTTPPLSPATSTCSVDSIELPPLPEVLVLLTKLPEEPKSLPFVAPIPTSYNEESAPISMWAKVARAKVQEAHVSQGEHAAGAPEIVGEHLERDY
ncbi:hypothetical protein BOTBODRAFT_187088 [Botryobasidium botryosum FD-172 SS1]|uniref:Uncharacterized protein n=1 Tax=Botryobasidium botryosum (strain FD-172 SS1) TaxID=930990 RepID=A0A067MLM1_BOTB1|nr:hypothetical protein BOTBODRAFT_187088 [Botryobasidium botryosum FD-172 SS1]